MTSKKEEKKLTVEEKVKIAQEKLGQSSADLAALLREGTSVVTAKGETLEIPALTGTAEKRAIKIIIDYLREHSEIIGKIFNEKIRPQDIISFLIDIADEGYEVVQSLAGALVGREREWVDKNLLLADLIAVVAPFLRAEVAPISRAVKGIMSREFLGGQLKAAMTKIQAMKGDTSAPSSEPSEEKKTLTK
jgi:hypothetical protein